MKFSSIFDCQPSEVVLAIFHENALIVTKQLLMNASDLKERIGALYLMYSVYYTIQSSKTKIRMTLSDWKYLMNLHQQIKVEEYLDANYILCKLIVERAFVHCISDNVYGIEKHFQKKKEEATPDYNILPEIKELAAPGKLLSTINDLSKMYEDKKRIILSKKAISSVQLYDANIADGIINGIRAMQSENRISFQNALFENICNDESMPSVSAPPAAPSTAPSTSTSASTLASVLPTTSESTSVLSVPQCNKKSRKRLLQRRKKMILSKIGHAFETALKSESEEEFSEEEFSEGEMLMDMDVDTDPLQGV